MPRIVVGVDGSAGADRALRWAGSLVDRHGGELTAVTVIAPPVATLLASPRMYDPAIVEQVEEEAGDQLTAAVQRVLGDRADRVERVVTRGTPAAELVDIAGDDLLVVGSRGLGGFRGLLLGSVSRQCVAHGDGSVVVVPERGDERLEPRRVVVGVDGSSDAAAALRWAADLVGVSKGIVEAVIAMPYPEVIGVPETFYPTQTTEEVEAAGHDVLRGAIVDALGPDPGVEIRPSVTIGQAAHRLLEAASDADLLVVGSRGRGGFSRLLLGSVSHQCATHAPCPVAIVRGTGSSAEG